MFQHKKFVVASMLYIGDVHIMHMIQIISVNCGDHFIVITLLDAWWPTFLLIDQFLYRSATYYLANLIAQLININTKHVE